MLTYENGNNAEIKTEVGRRKVALGDAEFELALSKALQGDITLAGEALTIAVCKRLDDWREPFVPASRSMLPAEEWKKIYSESERKARETLMESSAELSELSKLRRQQEEFERKARAQQARVDALWAEFNGLPPKAAAYRARINAVEAERRKLGPELDADFEAAFIALLGGDARRTIEVDCLSARIATRSLREKVLAAIESECNAELAKLDQKNASLARILSLPKHKLS